MAFVATTDFELPPYAIPNLENPETEDGSFGDIAGAYEAEELRDLLGPTLYDQFVAGLDVVSPAVPAAKWLALRDGGTYSYRNTTMTWMGMKKLLIPLVYFMYMRDIEVKKTQAGGSLAEAENSERVSISKQLCISYNEYAHRSGFEGCRSYFNSLYGFLAVNKDIDYPDWNDCSEVEYINHYGI